MKKSFCVRFFFCSFNCGLTRQCNNKSNRKQKVTGETNTSNDCMILFRGLKIDAHEPISFIKLFGVFVFFLFAYRHLFRQYLCVISVRCCFFFCSSLPSRNFNAFFFSFSCFTVTATYFPVKCAVHWLPVVWWWTQKKTHTFILFQRKKKLKNNFYVILRNISSSEITIKVGCAWCFICTHLLKWPWLVFVFLFLCLDEDWYKSVLSLNGLSPQILMSFLYYAP